MKGLVPKRFIKHGSNLAWIFGEQGLNIILSLISIPLMVRWLGPEKYGLITLYTAAVAIIGPLATGGIDSLLSKKLIENPDNREKAFGNAALVLLFGNVLTFTIAMSYVCYRWFTKGDSEDLAIGIAMTSVLLFRFQMVPVGFLQAEMVAGRAARARIAGQVVTHGGRAALVTLRAPAVAFGWVVNFGSGLVTLIFLYFTSLRSGMPSLKKWRYSIADAWTWRKSGFVLALTGMATMGYRSGDQLIVAEMLGNRQLGYYGAAVRLSEFAGLVPVAINTTLFPLLVKAKKLNRDLYENRILQLFRLQNFLTLGVCILLSFSSSLVVDLFYGEDFSKSAPIFATYIWTVLLVAQINTKTQVLLAEGAFGLLFKWTLITAALNIGLNYAFIPYFGLRGVVFASLASYSFLAFGVTFLEKKTQWVGKIQLLALVTPLPRLSKVQSAENNQSDIK